MYYRYTKSKKLDIGIMSARFLVCLHRSGKDTKILVTILPNFLHIYQLQKKIELNEYDFVGMYTNNSNNTVFDGYRSECK